MFENLNVLRNQSIIERQKISGGFSFETWKVTLEDGENLILRTAPKIKIENGKVFDPFEIFQREKSFYSLVNNEYPGRCPEVYEIIENYLSEDQAYQVMSYLEGTSIDKHIRTLDNSGKKLILKEIGIITAEINNIKPEEISNLNLGDWRKVFEKMLLERLNPLVDLDLLDVSHKDLILQTYLNQKIKNNKSLLHLDMRLTNLIYSEPNIHVIDSEHCRIGDPLYELAIVDVAGLLTKDFLEGYFSRTDFDLNIDSTIYKVYKLERLGALVYLFKCIVKNEEMFKNIYDIFLDIKSEILDKYDSSTMTTALNTTSEQRSTGE